MPTDPKTLKQYLQGLPSFLDVPEESRDDVWIDFVTGRAQKGMAGKWKQPVARVPKPALALLVASLKRDVKSFLLKTE